MRRTRDVGEDQALWDSDTVVAVFCNRWASGQGPLILSTDAMIEIDQIQRVFVSFWYVCKFKSNTAHAFIARWSKHKQWLLSFWTV